MLLLLYLNQNTYRFIINQELNDEVESAIQWALASESNISYNMIHAFSLYEKEYNTTLLRKHWGCYDFISSKSGYGNDSTFRYALVGTTHGTNEGLALYITNPTQKLRVSGEVEIKGDIYLPNATIEKKSIEGRQSIKDDISYNRLETTRSKLPAINEDIFIPYGFLEDNFLLKNSVSTDIFNKSDTVYNSFQNSTLCFYSPDNVNLNDNVIIGNIIIMSKASINVNSTCRLKDIILIADNVNMVDINNSNLQVYAKNNIVVKNSILDFPSSLMIYNQLDNSSEYKIVVDENSVINGSIILFCPETTNNLIVISKNSMVKGVVFSNSYVEHLGIIEGSLITNGLIRRTKNNVYINLLMDAKIDATKRFKEFINPNLFSNNLNKSIIKWLN